jgi:hypothetical protein
VLWMAPICLLVSVSLPGSVALSYRPRAHSSIRFMRLDARQASLWIVVIGFCMLHPILRLDIAGMDLAGYMMEILSGGGQSITATAERKIAREVE